MPRNDKKRVFCVITYRIEDIEHRLTSSLRQRGISSHRGYAADRRKIIRIERHDVESLWCIETQTSLARTSKRSKHSRIERAQSCQRICTKPWAGLIRRRVQRSRPRWRMTSKRPCTATNHKQAESIDGHARLLRATAHSAKRVLAIVMLSVCPSLCPSVTTRYQFKAN